jgi:hypothetical protein
MCLHLLADPPLKLAVSCSVLTTHEQALHSGMPATWGNTDAARSPAGDVVEDGGTTSRSDNRNNVRNGYFHWQMWESITAEMDGPARARRTSQRVRLMITLRPDARQLSRHNRYLVRPSQKAMSPIDSSVY